MVRLSALTWCANTMPDKAVAREAGHSGKRVGFTAQLLFIAATWGTSFLFIKMAVADGLPPFILATVRAAFAGIAIAVWLVVSGAGLRLPPTRAALVLGILNGFIPNILLAVALSRIDSAPAALHASHNADLRGAWRTFRLE